MKNQKAFTLVEVVIAISILAVVITTAYSSVTQILNSKKILDDKRDITIMANAILRRLTREFQLAISDTPLIFRDNDDISGGDNIIFLGESSGTSTSGYQDSLTFIAQEGGQYLPDGGAHTGLVQITYRVAQDPEKKNTSSDNMLIREEVPYVNMPSVSNLAEWEKARNKAFSEAMIFPVTENLVSFRLRFYDLAEESWRSDWGTEKRGSIPALIKFSITLRSPLGNLETYTTSVPVGSSSKDTAN